MPVLSAIVCFPSCSHVHHQSSPTLSLTHSLTRMTSLYRTPIHSATHKHCLARSPSLAQVKRSREKYKMRKKSAAEAPVATRGETADQQIESLKIKLAVLAKAHSKHQLTHAENEEVRRIMLEYAP
eukprot:m.34890 g.34890  ORF g.34890 m.34890 type:complete len:126 (-) comp9558_c0_seq1:215-592(-)